MATEDPLRYFLSLGGTTYPVKTIAGEEALSRTYRFEITLQVEPTDPLDPDALIFTDARSRSRAPPTNGGSRAW
ncbi:hypothetical protein [Polyangium mundeleinium]|uniref:Type VI secretion system tip protein VgrG n=1 Tax=Polyangium mundeleinium TaxID=2995306 RepID=A0ABT5F373_9BACT|nr:hypothetical protein [Polyangium mundeleinium]MDC0747521.1 hypothetical protein [Polyangium mundeleinium]